MKPESEPAQTPEELEVMDAAAAEGAVAAEEESADPFAQLEADALKWKELALRTAADLDNLRKRTAREREDAVRYGNQRLLEDLLPVIDNFEMGMMAAAQDKGSMIYIGMDMVRRQLVDFLAGQNVEEIPADGQEFDPNVHEAVSQEESTEPAGKVLRVTRRGFRIKDRLLRPASVIVSKGSESNS